MDYSIFKDRINYLFNGRGLSIRGLAADLGISTPTLSRYLSGDRAPDLPYLLRIADYFHVLHRLAPRHRRRPRGYHG